MHGLPNGTLNVPNFNKVTFCPPQVRTYHLRPPTGRCCIKFDVGSFHSHLLRKSKHGYIRTKIPGCLPQDLITSNESTTDCNQYHIHKPVCQLAGAVNEVLSVLHVWTLDIHHISVSYFTLRKLKKKKKQQCYLYNTKET